MCAGNLLEREENKMHKGYKMWHCGSGNKKNGVGIILKKEHVDRVVELWRVTI